jgi:hypothetical protein
LERVFERLAVVVVLVGWSNFIFKFTSRRFIAITITFTMNLQCAFLLFFQQIYNGCASYNVIDIATNL